LWVLTFEDTTEEENKTVNRNSWASDRNTNRVPHYYKIHALPLRKSASVTIRIRTCLKWGLEARSVFDSTSGCATEVAFECTRRKLSTELFWVTE